MTRRRARLGAIDSIAAGCLAVVLSSCATGTWYARVPEAERSAHLARQAIRGGMTFSEVVGVVTDVRSPAQAAAVESGRECAALDVKVVLHAGEMLANIGKTRVHAADPRLGTLTWVEEQDG